jgi:hypothetical protein
MAVLRYPYTALTNETDYLQLDIIKYKKIEGGLVSAANSRINTTQNNVGNTRNLSSTSVKEGTGTILLPMPSNLQDGNSVKYADDSLNGIVAAAIGPITGMMESVDPKNPSAIMTKFSGNLNQLADLALSEDVRKAIGRSLAAQAVGIFAGNVTPDQLLARQTGEIFNPNMELLFNGVTLRTFKFSFKMTPRNADESKQIKLIIKSLKQNMAPQAGSNAFYLKTPNIFELRYRKGNSNHPFLHRFKQCALTDISVNYTGENIYATYGDATPVSMIMDLTFRELQPIYAEDYSDPKDDTNDLYGGVGY